MTRVFLTLVCGEGSYADLIELYEPIAPYLSGVCAVCHAGPDSMEGKYLEVVKGEGCIIYLPYVGRHDTSRNVALHCGKIKQGEYVLQFDCLERVPATFAANIQVFIANLRTQGLNTAFFHHKPFLYEYHESLVFRGTPHEGITRQSGDMRAIELNQFYPSEADVRLNVRPQKRKDPLHWAYHYGRYYIATPWGSNHCLLGNEHRGDPIKLYQEREVLRIRFRDYLRDKGIPLTLDGLHGFMDSAPHDPMLIEVANKERIINDLYRLWVLKDATIVDDHTWAGMVTIPLDTSPQVK